MIWPRFAARRAQPYPRVADLDARGHKPLLKLIYAFFRNYALFCMGNMGWVRKVWKGYEALGSSDEFCWMLRERRVAMKWMSEWYTTLVRIILFANSPLF